MQYKMAKYALHTIAIVVIAYASIAAAAHHHITHHHDCITCHFQYDNTTDIHPQITIGQLYSIEYIKVKNQQYISLITNYSTSRSPPIVLT